MSDQVATSDRHRLARRHLGEAVGDLQQRLVLQLGRGAEGHVGLAGVGAHRGEVGERRGQRLAPNRSRAEGIEM